MTRASAKGLFPANARSWIVSQDELTSENPAVDMVVSLPGDTAPRLHLSLHDRPRTGYTTVPCSVGDSHSERADARQLTAPAESIAALSIDGILELLPFEDSLKLLGRCHHALLAGAEIAVASVDTESCAQQIVNAVDFASKTRALKQLYGEGQRDGWHVAKFEHVFSALGFDVEDIHRLPASQGSPPRIELRARKRVHLTPKTLASRLQSLLATSAHPLEAAGWTAKVGTGSTAGVAASSAPSPHAPPPEVNATVTEVKRLATEVEQHLASGRPERARTAALALLQHLPDHLDIMITLANIELALTNLDAAESHLIKASVVAEDNPQIGQDLARSFETLARRFEQSGAPDRAAICRSRAERQTSPANETTVSVVVLCFNQLKHTKLCLESIVAKTRAAYELIIVDNGSSDGTPEYLRSFAQEHEHVRLVINHDNLGFAGGNNCGMAVARGDLVVLINNDTVVTDGWLEAMIGTFDRNPGCMIVGPRSNQVTGPQLVADPGYQDLEAMPAFASEWASAHRGQDEESQRVIGFCIAIHSALIDDIGGLDEVFGRGNFEDDDFCLRTRAKGHRIFIAHEVFIHHTGGQTFKGENIDYVESMRLNWTIFKRKWGIPADLPLEQGYPLEVTAPATAVVPIPLPAIDTMYSAELDGRVLVQQDGGTTAGPAADSATRGDARSRAFDEAEAAAAAGDWPGSVKLFRTLTEQFPQFAPGHVGLGSSLLAIGECEGGGDAIERACDLEPENLPLRVQLGVSMAHAGNLQRAEAAFVEVLNHDPNHLDALLSLAALCRVSSHLPEAVELLNHANNVHPNEPDVLAGIAQLAKDLGDEAAATATMHALRALAPEHPALNPA